MAEEQNKGFWDYATPIITGVGSAAATGIWNNYALNKQNSFNAAEAEKNRQYEIQMSNTAYQRAYADMAAAGLNPHLAGGQGGASTPTGTAATSGSMMPLDIAGSVNAASNAALTKAQVQNMHADTEAKQKMSGKTESETKLINLQTGITEITAGLEQELMRTQDKKMRQEILVAQKELGRIKEQTDLIKAQKELAEWEARHPVLSKMLPGASGIAGGALGMAVGGPVGGAIGMGLGNAGKRKIGF